MATTDSPVRFQLPVSTAVGCHRKLAKEAGANEAIDILVFVGSEASLQ